MRAAAAGVAGGAQRLACTGELGQLLGVRLDEVRPGGDPAAQGLAPGVQEDGHPGGAGEPYEFRVRADVDAGREAAAEGHGLGPGEQVPERPQEGGPFTGAYVRARFVELGGVAAGAVDDGEGAAGVPRDGHERVGGALGERDEEFAQDGSGGAAA